MSSNGYKNEETLIKLYHEEGLSMAEIGKRYGVTGDAVRYYMDKFNIDRRSKYAEGYSQEELVGAIQKVADKLDKTPSIWEMEEHSEYSTGAYQNNFESFTDAQKQAGLDPNNYGTEMVACDNCGTEFEKSISLIRRDGHNFCDVECKYEFGRTELVCDWCETTFPAWRSYAENGLSDFCSPECYREHRSENYSGEGSPRWSRESLKCDYCGKSLERAPSMINNRNFCNDECMRMWQRETDENIGENHCNWAGGDVVYGPGWHRNRSRALERDGYECRICGMSDEAHNEKFGTDLHVHHIIKARKFDSAKERNSLDNLITLCRPHHQEWEGIPLKPVN